MITFSVHKDRHEVVQTGVMEAPRELVYKVYTSPGLVPMWWGPRSLTTTVYQMDVKTGCPWRFLQYDADGNQYAFHGIYCEVKPPERLVYTFEFEGMPGHELLETVMFTPQGTHCVLTATDMFQNLDDLESMMQAGMQAGAAETFERLNELVKAMLRDE